MKALNYLGTAALAAYAIFALAACNGTSNGSSGSTSTATTTTCPSTGINPYTGGTCTPGTTVSSSCVYNSTTGTYTDTYGNVCSTTGTGSIGTIGTIGTGTGTGTTVGGAPAGYPYGSYPTGSTNCQIYYYQYGVPYVPMYYNGTLVCANYYDLIASMNSTYYYTYTNSSYCNNLDYWYQYPPYGGTSSYGYGGSDYAYLSGSYASNFSGGGSGFYLNFGISF